VVGCSRVADPHPGHHEGVRMSESQPSSQQPDAAGGGDGSPTGSSAGGATPSGPAPTPQERLAGMHRLDLATIAVGLLALLASFMPYYTMSFDLGAFGGDTSTSASAWHGFLGWFGALCALAAAAVLAAHLFDVTLPVPVRLVVLALFGVALLCTLLAMFVYPGESCEDALGAFGGEAACEGLDEGRGIGYWLALISTAAGTALAAMRRSAA